MFPPILSHINEIGILCGLSTFLDIRWALFHSQPDPLLHNHPPDRSVLPLPSQWCLSLVTPTGPWRLSSYCSKPSNFLFFLQTLRYIFSLGERNPEICRFRPNLGEQRPHPILSSPNKTLG